MAKTVLEFPGALTSVPVIPLGLSPEMERLKILTREIFESLLFIEALGLTPDKYAICLAELRTLLDELRVKPL